MCVGTCSYKPTMGVCFRCFHVFCPASNPHEPFPPELASPDLVARIDDVMAVPCWYIVDIEGKVVLIYRA